MFLLYDAAELLLYELYSVSITYNIMSAIKLSLPCLAADTCRSEVYNSRFTLWNSGALLSSIFSHVRLMQRITEEFLLTRMDQLCAAFLHQMRKSRSSGAPPDCCTFTVNVGVSVPPTDVLFV